jgi:tyrosine-protein phosphatase MSG5
MTSTTSELSSSRKKGPPPPLNLQSRANSVPVAPAGPDFIEEHHPTPTEKPAMLPKGPGSSRNIKRLSLSVSSLNDVQTALPPAHMAQPALPQPPAKRRSVVSLPAGASAASVLRRNDEGDDAPAAAYLDGPIEIMPGVWLGSEDNARDWKGLVQRGIKAILNVAKEVASPYESASHPSIGNTAATPNVNTLPRYAATLQPAHLPSGRPSMHYLKLAWSHGQADLVRTGFAEAMSFIDEALNRHHGVLVQ